MAVLVSGCRMAEGAGEGPTATLRCDIVDARSGEAVPCTVELTDATGRLVTRSAGYTRGFRCAGDFVETVPPGRTLVRVRRGFEYRAAERALELAPGESQNLRIALERVVDLRARGWYAGDSHVHMIHGERTLPVRFEEVALAAAAEDLHHLSLSHAWEHPDPTPEALEQKLGPLSTPDCQLTWNLEAPKNYYRGDAGRCLGHCWSLGVRGRTATGLDVIPLLLAASAGDYESSKPACANFESHRLIHEQGGAVFYTHPLRWWTGTWGGRGGYPVQEKMRISNMAVELPLDVLIGPTFDGLDVITGAGEHGANQKAFQLWRLLLNHGYRLAATGSSDTCFDRPGGAVPGVPRTYTHLDGEFSLEKVTKATAAGHTFVTTGPLLLASVDGKPPGTRFGTGSRQRELAIEAWASGADRKGLTRIEILRNGVSQRIIRLEPPRLSWQTNLVLEGAETAWYCVRAWGGDDRTQQAITGAFHFESPSDQVPEPVRPHVQVRLVDADTGDPLSGTLTEVAYAGPLPHPGRQHPIVQGELSCTVPGTVRLRADVPGYEPLTLSPFLDCPELVRFITGLDDQALLDWSTYERVRELLGVLELTFSMKRGPD